jgi:hypothetical protein
MPIRLILALVLVLAGASAAFAQKAPFDLAGPTLQVSVTRGADTLPIAQVPALAAGDVLHVRAVLPSQEGTRYVLVVAFLRGASNPPPKDWFFAARTWEKKDSGLDITAPAGAQQALAFLVPRTVGDVGTLAGTVRGRPGVFVRAAQDLEQLDLDRARLERFLAAVHETDVSHPQDLQDVSTSLARSLGVKLDQSCFTRSPDLQAPCLLKDQDSLLLDDGHSTSTVAGLASGASADLVAQLGYAPAMGGGLYSPYVGAVMDIVRILDGLHTAHLQYIPALALADGDHLTLKLNTAPSFANPKSVLVVALPPVGPTPAPALHALDPEDGSCLAKPDLVLGVDGEPLMFATDFAHDLALETKTPGGEARRIPVRADAARGGLVLAGATDDAKALGGAPSAVLAGRWGFDAFEGPAFRLAAGADAWRVAADDEQALVTGRTDTLRLVGGAAPCVERVELQSASAPPQPVAFKLAGPDALTLTVPLPDIRPGDASLVVEAAGAQPQRLAVRAYDPAGRLDRLVYHAGDVSAVLEGARLDKVVGLSLAGARFQPVKLASSGPVDILELTAPAAPAEAATRPGAKLAARVNLEDGRSERLEVVVLAARPRIDITAVTTQRAPPAAGGTPSLELGDKSEIPRGAVVAFSIAAPAPEAFSAHESVEVETADGDGSARLEAPGALVLADAHAAVATLDTAKAFDPSAYGALRARVADANGESDWASLGTLVRLPRVEAIACPPKGATCHLQGEQLFLIAAVSADKAFDDPVSVPDGFPGQSLETPRPRDGRLYVKLHDDPDVVSVLRLK